MNEKRKPRNPIIPKNRGSSSVTIKQVAEKAGVSTATISRVLSGRGYVSFEMRQRVLEAVAELNYQPDRTARNLRRRVSQIIGVVISDIQNPFFTSLIRGIESVIEEDNFVILLSNSDEDPRREKIQLNTLEAERVSGIIISPCRSNSDELRKLVSEHMPVVVIDRTIARLKVDAVAVHNVQAACDAVLHLASLRHRRIALICGPEWVSTGAERRQGFLQGMRTAGIPILNEYLQVGDFRQESGYLAMKRLLDLPQRPTAVLVGNNLMTLGALQAIHEVCVAIPDEIAVIGFDDMSWATSLQPPLTVIAQPTFEMGVTAARLLLDRIENPDLPTRHVILDTQLIVRTSSCPA
jgi:DNA-binding LacI/PurR family transcriptional regulator